MSSTTGDRAGGIRRFLSAGLSALGLTLGLIVAGTAAQNATPIFSLRDVEVPPTAGFDVLLQTEPIPQELRLSEAQTRELESRLDPMRQGIRKKVENARRDTKNRDAVKNVETAYSADYRAVVQQVLRPEQWQRLDQIQLQLQGPLAFDRPDEGTWTAMTYVGPPLVERLKLSDEQIKRIRPIVADANRQIQKAASFPISLNARIKLSTSDLDRYVASAEFQAARKKAGAAGRDAALAAVRRLEDVLTDTQRQAYHAALGEPFDLSRLKNGAPDRERRLDRIIVSRALSGVKGTGGGQRSDPDFDPKIARPAYAAGATHPRVLFDEAHHNFHTADGRYKPFADLMANDGYQIIRNRDSFTRDVLQKGDILIIANALGSERMGSPDAGNSAFTDAECDAVRDWVREGGSLLLITDHAPMGAAAERMAGRFGVGVSKGAVGDPKNSAEGRETFLVFSRQNRLLGDHPITNGRDASERLSKVETFTGTSLKGPADSVPILKLADTAVERSMGGTARVSAAGRVQGLALRFGKGRVVVMGEAAELSAQITGIDNRVGMSVPGIDNRQLALNILHWLSGLLEPRDGALRKAG